MIRLLGLISVLIPMAINAAAETGPARLPCRDPERALRNGSFDLDVGPVRLRDGKACPTEPGFPCDWSIELSKTERWGPSGNGGFLLVEVDADHIGGSGAWRSVLIYHCVKGTFVQVFADRFLYGADVELGPGSDFWITAGVWLEGDPTCCPSRERRRHYVWRRSENGFVVTDSTEKRVKR